MLDKFLNMSGYFDINIYVIEVNNAHKICDTARVTCHLSDKFAINFKLIEINFQHHVTVNINFNHILGLKTVHQYYYEYYNHTQPVSGYALLRRRCLENWGPNLKCLLYL